MQSHIILRSIAISLLLLSLTLSPQVAAQTSLLRDTFENGADGAPISSNITGVTLSTTEGTRWRYADIRTGNYNAPYPEDCRPRFENPCAYTIDGKVAAWLGPEATTGRIEFAGDEVTAFAASFSTGTTVTISAFTSQGQLVGSQSVAANLRTGRLDRVKLQAPANTSLAYITITGLGNYWFLDNLEVERRDSPVSEESQTSARKPAFLTVAQTNRIAGESETQQTLITTVVTKNRGKGKALNAVQVLSFNPSRLELLDVQTSRREVWVSQALTNTLVLQTGPLAANGEVVTATVRFRLLAPFEQSSYLGERVSFTWRDGAGGGSGQSNAPQISSSPEGLLPLLVEQATESLSITIQGTFFIPKEPVSVWYNMPGGQVVAVNTTQADETGTATIELEAAGMEPGAYSLVMRGNWSELTGIAPFNIFSGEKG